MTIETLKNSLLKNLYLAISVLSSMFFVFVLLIPSISSIPSSKEQIKIKVEELKNLKQRSTRLNALLTNQSTLKTNLRLVDLAIPSKELVPTLMTQVQRIATESGTILKALQFGSVSVTNSGTGGRITDDKRIKKISLQALVQGEFSEIQTFLRNLENASRLLTVDSISFEAKKDTEKITATMVLASYYIENPAFDMLEALDLSDEGVRSALEKLKKLKIYEIEATPSAVGKANPFE